MNRTEFYNTSPVTKTHYRFVHKLLKQWKIDNNIPSKIRCVVHHRDDTDEAKVYNDAHYELWGRNEDGSFEYGKYVVFMTLSEHSVHHQKGKTHSEETKKKMSASRKGCKNHNFGEHLSEETKKKMSASHKGKTHSEETKKKMSEACKGDKNPMYGKHCSEETKKKMSASHKGKPYSEEYMQKLLQVSTAYKQYKESGGELSWFDFRKVFAEAKLSK